MQHAEGRSRGAGITVYDVRTQVRRVLDIDADGERLIESGKLVRSVLEDIRDGWCDNPAACAEELLFLADWHVEDLEEYAKNKRRTFVTVAQVKRMPRPTIQ